MTTQSSPLKGSAAGILDYLYDEVLGYYEAGPGEAPRRPRDMADHEIVFGLNQIHGHAPAALGIDFAATGGMTKGQFYSLAAGRHPVTGDQLVERRSRAVYVTGKDGRPLLDGSGNKVAKVNARTGEPIREVTSHVGVDVYFAAPKSVSIARVVAEEENPALGRAISEAHARAVRETLRQIEATALLGRRTVATPTEVGPRTVSKGPRKGEACLTQGSATERVPVELLVVSVAQHCARPTEETQSRGAPPDMHLHQHNLILNVGFDPATGKACAIDNYGLKSAAAMHDAWYLGHLSRELQSLGLELEFGSFQDSRHGRVPWRVKGINEAAEDHYSSNRRRAWNLAKDYEERHPGKAATPSILKERMRGTRMAKDEIAKAQDSAPVWQLWTNDAAKARIPLATEKLRRRMREGHRVDTLSAERRGEVFQQRLTSANGLTKDDATFAGASVAEAVARCAEGLGYTTDELAHLELETFSSLVVLRPARDPRHVLYTTQGQLDLEHRIESAVGHKVAEVRSAPGPRTIADAIAGARVVLDDEQRGVVELACSGHGAVFIEGYAGTGKTTAMATVLDAYRRAGLIDQVAVVSTAALTAQSSGSRLGADFSGSVESFADTVARGRLTMTDRTVVIFDEAAMCDTARQDRFLAAAGSARVIYVGDPEQAQPIGPSGWYRDAVDRHGARTLTAVHRQRHAADIEDLAQLRDGSGAAAVANLLARSRLHISEDEQGAFSAVINDYALHRDAGREADEVVVLLDSSNARVDVANRQIQLWRQARQEIKAGSFEVEERSTDRHWRLHAGDPVLFLRAHGRGEDRIANGTRATIRQLDPLTGAAVLDLQGARSGQAVELQLSARADHQTVGLAYAVHTTKYQGGEAPVVLMLPGAPGQSDKFSAYSTLSRAVEEVHIYPNQETHGEDAAASLARSWSQADPKRSARSYLAETKGSTMAGNPPRFSHEMAAEAAIRDLRRQIGADRLKALRDSKSFPELKDKLVDAERRGLDSGRMLEESARVAERAATERPRAGEAAAAPEVGERYQQDPAAELSRQFEKQREVTRYAHDGEPVGYRDQPRRPGDEYYRRRMDGPDDDPSGPPPPDDKGPDGPDDHGPDGPDDRGPDGPGSDYEPRHSSSKGPDGPGEVEEPNRDYSPRHSAKKPPETPKASQAPEAVIPAQTVQAPPRHNPAPAQSTPAEPAQAPRPRVSPSESPVTRMAANDDLRRPTPNDDLRRPTPNDDLRRPTPNDDLRRPTPNDDLRRPTAKEDLRRPVANDDLRQAATQKQDQQSLSRGRHL